MNFLGKEIGEQVLRVIKLCKAVDRQSNEEPFFNYLAGIVVMELNIAEKRGLAKAEAFTHCKICGEEYGMNETPRRIQVDLMTPAELAIREAMRIVEDAGADPLLTDAVVLLGQAKEKVADFVDKTDTPDGDEK